ncbi:hypothetical protein BGZ59_009020 [Podila verticillata]|uniref:SCP2 domain-containing protein n=1 Tax=Podila verticillata NRRL 6337 TaxID=1069443 RepID=A0A086TJ49_9FUNG|nr:hypothetical protein BGZ59_009020 [Podila verticillata]KFH61976.1 hypothetical protein MVEG_12130 [Podila verticillata NRRL 6337]
MSISVEGYKTSAVLTQLDDHFKTLTPAQRKEQVSKVKGVFQFDVKNEAGKVQTWTLDLKNGEGSIQTGTISGKKPDITIEIADQTFVDLAEGKANGQKLFMSGKIKAKGAVMLATKLDAVLKSTQTKAKL